MSLPEGWREILYRDMIDIVIDNRGKNPKSYSELGIPVIDNFLISNERKINLSDVKRFIDDETYSNFLRKYIEPNDVLMTLVGNGYGNVALAPIVKSAIIQNTIGMRCNKDNDNIFLYYLFLYSKKQIVKLDIGAAQPSIKVGSLLALNCNVPPLQEQKAIANILSSFDEKIELLKEQNETLEQMAQGVFREWFVDEVDESWEDGVLSDEFKITMGQSPKGDTYNENDDGMVFYQGRAEFQNRFPKKRLCTTEPKRLAEKFDVLMSVRAPVGDINVASEQCCIGRGLSAINSEYKSYMLYKMKSLKKQFDMFESEGTVFGSINKTSLENLEVLIPPIELVEKYNLFAIPIDSKIYNNTTQIQTLQKTRDTLLPKLMSGEVRVGGDCHRTD